MIAGTEEAVETQHGTPFPHWGTRLLATVSVSSSSRSVAPPPTPTPENSLPDENQLALLLLRSPQAGTGWPRVQRGTPPPQWHKSCRRTPCPTALLRGPEQSTGWLTGSSPSPSPTNPSSTGTGIPFAGSASREQF